MKYQAFYSLRYWHDREVNSKHMQDVLLKKHFIWLNAGPRDRFCVQGTEHSGLITAGKFQSSPMV